MTFVLKINDTSYPDCLRHVYRPPVKLFVKGDLSAFDRTLIAFVGTRKNSSYGEYAVNKLISELSCFNISVVSGLALGIDTLSHKAAIKYGLPTIAVLGTGIDNIYPSTNQNLANEIVRNHGLVISEYDGDSPPLNFHFPERNRIVAGMCVATVVIEAPESSGALITAKLANENGRDVFAVPADIDRKESFGCNKLISDLIARPALNGLSIIKEMIKQPELIRPISSNGSAIDILPSDMNCLSIMKVINRTRPKSAEQISIESRLDLVDTIKALSLLELNSMVKTTQFGLYIKSSP